MKTYQSSITSTLIDCIFSDVEIANFQLKDDSQPALFKLFTLEFRPQKAHWLSAVSLENRQEDNNLSRRKTISSRLVQSRHPRRQRSRLNINYNPIVGNIGAGEREGDAARACLDLGWRVLWRLSDISRGVLHEYREKTRTDMSFSQNRPSSLTRGLLLSDVQTIEDTIVQKQIEYISNLHEHAWIGYHFASANLAGVFRDRVFDDHSIKEHPDKNPDGSTGNSFSNRNSFLNWLVLREGPSFFLRAWSGEAGNTTCMEHIMREWTGRSEGQLAIERVAAYNVEAYLYAGAADASRLDFLTSLQYYRKHVWYAEPGREFEREYTDVTFHLGKRLAKSVILEMEGPIFTLVTR